MSAAAISFLSKHVIRVEARVEASLLYLRVVLRVRVRVRISVRVRVGVKVRIVRLRLEFALANPKPEGLTRSAAMTLALA